MKTLIRVLLVGVLLGSTGSGVLMADVKKGQKHYLKSFKSKFHINGTKFAALHTQDEWEALFMNEGEGFKMLVDAEAVGYLQGCDIDSVATGLNACFVFKHFFHYLFDNLISPIS